MRASSPGAKHRPVRVPGIPCWRPVRSRPEPFTRPRPEGHGPTMTTPASLSRLARYDGPEVDAYERELAEYFGVRYVTCVSSGTAAIHSALGALDLEPGTEVIVSSFTDPGSVMPLFFQQLIPVFVEHDYDTLLMSAEGVRAAITPHTGAVIVAQLHGYVADMEGIRAAAGRNIPIIGDCSQAHGSTVEGDRSAPFGDIGAMSLMSGKHMVAGGQAGMVATNDEGIYWAAQRFADRGKPV